MLVTQVKKEKQKPKQLNLKVSAEVEEALQKQADKYANGNLSEWLRYAGLNHVPPKKDLVPNPKKKK